MPALSATISFTDVYSTTISHHRPQVALEIMQGNALVGHMYAQNAVKYVGGPEVRQPVVVTDNGNAQAISKHQTFNVAVQDGPDMARYDRDTHRGTLIAPTLLSKEDLAANTGAEQIVNLVQAKMAQSKQTLTNLLSTQIYTAQAVSGTDMKGLPDFLEATAEASQTGTVGGISKAAYANWRNRYRQIATFASNGFLRMKQAFLDASDSGSHPDIILMDPDAYILMDELLLPNQKRQDKALYDMGYDNLLFHGTPCVPEPSLSGTGLIYMLTTTGKRNPSTLGFDVSHFKEPGKNPQIKDNLKAVPGFCLYVAPDHDFVMEGPFDVSWQQRALIWNLVWSGMLCTGSLKRNAVLDFVGGSAV